MTAGGRGRLRPGGALARVRGLRGKEQGCRPQENSAVRAQGPECRRDREAQGLGHR